MGFSKAGEKCRCNVCGNDIEITKAGGGTLVCGGQPMELLE
ncbi:MAG: desulfoferrodoxin FeS4 iron-binding domain-containing protein [Candidatus Bathyarchaeia archaeon]